MEKGVTALQVGAPDTDDKLLVNVEAPEELENQEGGRTQFCKKWSSAFHGAVEDPVFLHDLFPLFQAQTMHMLNTLKRMILGMGE